MSGLTRESEELVRDFADRWDGPEVNLAGEDWLAFMRDRLAAIEAAAAQRALEDADRAWSAARYLSDLVNERHPGHFGDVIAPADVLRAIGGVSDVG